MSNRHKELFESLQELVDAQEVVIDRAKGSSHPRFPDYIYPLDYGYLDGTRSQDGGGIDVWCGSSDRSEIFGILVCVDAVKKDSEIKVLLGCDQNEADEALACSNRGSMNSILVVKGQT